MLTPICVNIVDDRDLVSHEGLIWWELPQRPSTRTPAPRQAENLFEL
jgi:hypothetical protein